MTAGTLPAEVSAINIGLPLFADALAAQDAPVTPVDWRPPAGGDEESRVRHHAVLRAYGQAHRVPRAKQGLPGVGLGEPGDVRGLPAGQLVHLAAGERASTR